MLIVIAEKEELKLVEELGFSEFPVLITGVGALNVIDALKDLPKDTEILNIGYCGSNFYDIGSKLQIRWVGTHHTIAKFNELSLGMKTLEFYNIDDITSCYTSTDFVTELSEIKDCVFDMELAFIRAIMPNTRAIKVVSDNLDKKQYRENV